jgi:hypothetical protein
VTAPENSIRDELAIRLDLIEPGLSHVASNYHLRNTSGADGFVDILARDSTGSFVVIELKKSDSTSRQALHEVSKYVDLLSRDKGLLPESIRAMIVSTDWHELLVPFSYYVDQTSFDLRGFALKLAGDGLTPTEALVVDVLPRSQPRVLTASQRRIEKPTSQQLATAWTSVRGRLSSLDVVDFVALHLSDGADAEMIVLVLGTATDDSCRAEMERVLRAQDAWDDDYDSLPTEELVLLGMEHEGHPLGVCYPEKIGALIRGHGWQLDKLERFGVFEDTDLFPDEDIRDACEGWSGGLSTVHYAGRARTRNKAQWTSFRGSTSMVIADSPGWVAPTRLWLDEVEAANPQWDISVSAYDSHDFLQALMHHYKTPEWHEAVPFLSFAVEAPNNASYGLFAYLYWDGTVVDLVSGVRTAYRTVGDWGDLRAFNAQAEANLRLMKAWHLSYRVTEKLASQPLPKILMAEGDTLKRQKLRERYAQDWMPKSLLMVDFLEAHEQQLDDLVAYLKDHVFVDPSTATQMHLFDARVDSNWY